MSSKYQREIEEILRKFDDRQPTVSDRIRSMNRRPARIRRRLSLRFSQEMGLITGVILAFAAATMRWITQTPTTVEDGVIGVLALASAAIIIFTLFVAWIGGTSSAAPMWRGQSLDQGGRGPRRTPFNQLRTRLQLIRLRMDYHSRQNPLS
jgi:hypothetical protein